MLPLLNDVERVKSLQYRTQGRKTTHYPEVETTEEIYFATKHALPTFGWCYHIVGKDLELFDDADLSNTPKTEKNIHICISCLDYGLKLPL